MELFEINMLEIIQKHDYISQRDISSEVGISLGMVNILLKKFVKTGLIKAERLDGNKVKYMLTPSGFTYLSKKTIDFVARSYQAVIKIQNHMSQVIEQNYSEHEQVVILGIRDEIGEILEGILKKRGNPYIWVIDTVNHPKFIQWQDPQGDGIYILKG